MDKEKTHIIKEYIEIPKQFYSTVTEKPFSNCLSCDKYLLQSHTPYVIEKAVKQYSEYKTTDVIFEYAMCMDCYQNIHATMSASSKEKIEQYFSDNVDLIERRKLLLEKEELSVNHWTSSCIIKGTHIKDLNEYQIACQCDGEYLLFTNMPFIIGNAALNEMMQLLSNQTIGEIRGFYDKFFSPDPDLKKLFDEPKFVLL